MVITAHYDHLGIQNGYIFNGADDNASGVSALLTIAKYFKNKQLNHNLILAAFDGQEAGSLGAENFLDTYKNKSNIALNVNMEMISHSDFDPEIFICGTYHYPNLKKQMSKIVTENISVLFGHDDPYNREQVDWTFLGDHRVFHRQNIPFVYFGVEDHKDYHKPSDDFENINQAFYIEVVKVIIQTIENLDQFLFEENK
ncbi:MAG: M28 family peptidase [Polaribacter sp.]|nr:M28 family peptidase [Polaribacter sp.]